MAIRSSVARKITISQVVDHDDEKVRFGFSAERGSNQGENRDWRDKLKKRFHERSILAFTRFHQPMKVPFFLLILAMTFMLSQVGNMKAEELPGVEMGKAGVPNFIACLEKDRKAHVAFIGGSITQKASGHTAMVAEWLRQEWPGVEFTFTNAGLSSTCSVSGAFRLDRDVLSQGQIDLLIVEFAVNDDQDAGHDRKTAIRGLEGMFRQYFNANPTGDAISVQFVNKSMLDKILKGEEAVSATSHKEVARHYGAPIADVGQALAVEIKEGRMTWEDDYKDAHPTDGGYRFATSLITGIIENTISGETPTPVSLPEPLDPGSYFNAVAVDPQKFEWLGGWKWAPVSRELLPVGGIREQYKPYHALRSDEAGSYLYFAFQGTMLGAFVLAGPDAGNLEVSINKGEWQEVQLYHERHSKGLNYPRSVILADDLARGYHQVAIRVAEGRSERSKGNTATILFFEVNR